jgi:hypothetical protein
LVRAREHHEFANPLWCIRFGFDVNVIHVIVIFPREQVRLCSFRFLLGSVKAESFAVDGLARLKILALQYDPGRKVGLASIG